MDPLRNMYYSGETSVSVDVLNTSSNEEQFVDKRDSIPVIVEDTVEESCENENPSQLVIPKL